MPQEYKDASYSLNTGIEGQVAPTFISQPGALTTGGLNLVTAQLTTQVNPFPTIVTGQSNAMAEQVLVVGGPLYNSPGGILNKAAGSVTTGGGP